MSQFSDAIMQGMVQNLDPMNGIVRQYAAEQLESTRVSVATDKLTIIDELQKRITEGKAQEVDGRVLEGYQRMLKSFTT